VSLVRNVATTLLAKLAVLSLALVSSMVLARVLGPEGRGLFARLLLFSYPNWQRRFAS